MLDWQLGVCPIQAEHPAGSNPRDGDAFALLEAEINKRLDLHGQASTDWLLVSKLASTILREEGKDLSVATWLLLGWAYCKGALGLAAGVRVLHDMHVHYWDTMAPPVARLRGRRNQMEWLLQELEATLSKRSEGWAALTPQQHAELLLDWDALDTLWQGHDDQAPALFKLRRMLLELAPEQGDDAPGAADEPEASSPNASDVENAPDAFNTANASNASNISGASSAPDTSEASRLARVTRVSDDSDQVSEASPSAGQEAEEGGSSKSHPPAAHVKTGDDAVPDSSDAVERVIDHGLEAMHAVLRDLPDDLIMMPVLYRLNRVRAWLTLDALPPAVEGVSRIPAPPPADQDGLQRLIDADDALSVLRFAESRLVPHRFWLDLNRIAYQAAQALPDGQLIGDVIALESLYLLQRLPGLHDLSFINGQPFADPATRDWLVSLAGAKSTPAVQPGRTDSVQLPVSADTLSMATLLAAAGAETQAAARLLDVVAARLQSGSEHFIQRQGAPD